MDRFSNNSVWELKEYLGYYFNNNNDFIKYNYKYYPVNTNIINNTLCFKINCKFKDYFCNNDYFSIDLLFCLFINYIKNSLINEGNNIIISVYYFINSILCIIMKNK